MNDISPIIDDIWKCIPYEKKKTNFLSYYKTLENIIPDNCSCIKHSGDDEKNSISFFNEMGVDITDFNKSIIKQISKSLYEDTYTDFETLNLDEMYAFI
jgi:hypothetical protein